MSAPRPPAGSVGRLAPIAYTSRGMDPALRARLDAFAELLLHWNRAYNLIGVGATRTLWTHHLLDSLAVLTLVEGETVADVGSGAGFPGLVLALACPARRFLLIEANGKKVRFLAQAQRELDLPNLEVIHARAEDLATGRLPGVGTLITRALGTIPYFLEVSAHLAGDGAQWLAMKGRIPHQEIRALPGGFRVKQIWQIRIEGLDAERHVIELHRGDPAQGGTGGFPMTTGSALE